MTTLTQLSLFLFFLSPTLLMAQAGFEKFYTAAYTNEVHTSCPIDNETFVMSGKANDLGLGYWDFTLIKSDTAGNILFSYRYQNDDYWEQAVDVVSVSDGGFLVLFLADSLPDGPFLYNLGLARLDDNGAVTWAKKIVVTHKMTPTSLIECDNGDFVITAHQPDPIFSGTQGVIFRTDHDGDMIWSKWFDYTTHSGQDKFFNVMETSAGDLMVVGSAATPAGNDVCVVKYNAAGDTLWTKVYGQPGYDAGYCITETAGGSFYITGFADMFPPVTQGSFLAEIDASGNLVQSKLFGHIHQFHAHNHLELNNGNILVSGQFVDQSSGTIQVRLVLLAPDGTIQDGVTFTENGVIYADNLFSIPNESAVITGTRFYSGSGMSKPFIVNTGTVFFNPCLGDVGSPGDTIITYSENASTHLIGDNPLAWIPLSYTPIAMPLTDSTRCTYNYSDIPQFQQDNSAIVLFPNPSEDVVRIESPVPVSWVEIYTPQGQKISETGEKDVDVRSLPDGTYIIVLTLSNEEKAVRRMIRH